MKLKKIASLALAGIMAVSMLTACGEGTGNGNLHDNAGMIPDDSYVIVRLWRNDGHNGQTKGQMVGQIRRDVNQENFIDYKSFLIFAGAFILTWKFKIHPILMILLAGVAGLVLYW